MKKDLPALLGGKPVFNDIVYLARPYLPKFSDISKQMKQLFEDGHITNFRYVKEFEEAAAGYLGVKYAVALSSCTSGLMLTLKSLKLEGEVIIPSFTFLATGHAAHWNNLKPVLVDCDPESFCISVAEAEKYITNKTSAILAVDIFGNTPDIYNLEKISKKHNIKLIFDSAHAFGSEYKGRKVGSFGEAEVFSLSPSKVLTTGEGGIVATNNKELARMVRIGRDYGNPGNYDPEYVGLSVRMTEFSALIGLRTLSVIDDVVAKRNDRAKKYLKLLSGVPGLSFQKIRSNDYSTYKMFAVLVDEKQFGISSDVLMEALAAENIQTRRYFYPPLHKQKIYKSCKKGDMKNTDMISSSVICLPMNPYMKDNDINKIYHAIKRIYNAKEKFKK